MFSFSSYYSCYALSHSYVPIPNQVCGHSGIWKLRIVSVAPMGIHLNIVNIALIPVNKERFIRKVVGPSIQSWTSCAVELSDKSTATWLFSIASSFLGPRGQRMSMAISPSQHTENYINKLIGQFQSRLENSKIRQPFLFNDFLYKDFLKRTSSTRTS